MNIKTHPGVHPEVDERIDARVCQGQKEEHCVDISHQLSVVRIIRVLLGLHLLLNIWDHFGFIWTLMDLFKQTLISAPKTKVLFGRGALW